MCQHQPIPPTDYNDRIRTILEAAQETPDEGQDIFAFDHHNLGSNDQIVEDLNYITTTLDVANLEDNLLNRGRIRIPYSLPSDYEDIFKLPGFSRRTARPINTNDPTDISIEAVLLIEDWVELCLDAPDTATDGVLPGDMTAFQGMMEHGMPSRLTTDSWIAKTLVNMVVEEYVPFDTHRDCFTTWQPETSTEHVRFQADRNGRLVAVINFIGAAKPGRLVWTPANQHPPLINLDRGTVAAMEEAVANAEAALVALARRIALYIASSIVYQYAAPKAEERGHDILTPTQIVGAVREILGEEWFDLPFDVENRRRDWSVEDVWTHGVDIEA